MSYSYLSILELAFFRKANFKYFTSPDHVILFKNGDNGPPYLSLSIDRSNTHDQDVMWHVYDEGKVDLRTCDGSYTEPSHSHERLLNLCLLMLGLYVENDEDITMIARGFSNRIVDTKGFFNPYRELDDRQIGYLLRMARERFSRKYFVLSYCRQGIDIIQDIQKETAGMCLLQFRYENEDLFLE